MGDDSADAKTAISKAIDENHASVDIHYVQIGITDDQPTVKSTNSIDDLREKFADFSAVKDRSPVNLTLQLLHYSMVDSRIPLDVNIKPGIFAKMKELYSNVWKIKFLSQSLPVKYTEKEEYEGLFQSFTNDYSAFTETLPNDPKKLDDLSARSKDIIKKCNKVLDRYAFY
ncbi:MAG: hypothetical protein HRO68_04520 [Nitrosopumilus sp.]|nr:hypothetical protein [Nitrosopumilus sp.]